MHINEDKIHAVGRMVHLLVGDLNAQEPERASTSTQTPVDNLASGVIPSSAIFDSVQLGNEALLILVYFCINDLSIEVQSLEKSIVELQVTGVKASLTKRLQETNLGLSVHSLLLVDAIQTLGKILDKSEFIIVSKDL